MTTRKQAYHRAVAALPRPSLAMRAYIKAQRRQAESETNETADATQEAYRASSEKERRVLLEISRSLDAEYPLG